MCVPSSGSSDRKKAELRNTDPVSPPQQVPMGLKATVKSSQKDLWTFVFDSFLSKLSREVAVRPSSSSFMRIWWLSAAKHAGAKKSAALTGRRRSHSEGNSGTGQLETLQPRSLWWRLHNQALSEISGTHGFGCSTKIKSEDSWEVSKDWTAEASEKAKTLFQTTLNFKHCLLSVCFIYYIVLCETHRCKWAALLQFFILILMSINVNTKTNILQQLADFSTNFGKDAALQTFLLFTFEKFS